MSVTFLHGEVVEVGEGLLARLKEAAARAPRRRARLCLHPHLGAGVQQMVIALWRGSYVRPHRHPGKIESFQAIEGELDVVLFDERGQVARRVRLGPAGGRGSFLYRLEAPLWHTVAPRSPLVVFHEVTSGPFVPGSVEQAPWAPPEDDHAAARAFMERLTVNS